MSRGREEVDVLVVGSGGGGGTLACALAEAGARVLVLEKGPHYSLYDFTHDELAICRRNFFVPYVSDEPHLVRRNGERHQRTNDGWISCCVGGGTVHMSGFFFRLHRDDLQQRTRLGAPAGSTVEDWPIPYEELARWYDRAEILIGVSGQAGENPFDEPRAGAFPLPPLLAHPAGRRLADAARGLGWHPFTTPRAVLSDAYDGRPPCNYCGFCGSYGCENGSKSSVLSTFIPRALKTGRCRLRAQAMVREITVDENGRARGAVYQDRAGGLHEVRARAVVVACSAIESARLLLLSRSSRFPQGLANSSGLVGKNLSFSLFAAVEADFRRDGGAKSVPVFDGALPWLGVAVQDFYRLPAAAGGHKGGTLRFDFVHPNPIYNAEHVAKHTDPPLFGQALKDRLRRHFRDTRTLECEIFAEYLPSAETFVELDPDARDRYGLPAARVSVAHHPTDVPVARFLAERAQELFRAMGADEVRVAAALGTTFVLQHGTCRFGVDPARSVLDPTCRAHDVPNLYVVDGSFMPTSGGVPTTLTIQANALRVADALAGRLTRREL
ncbi:MAG TPA: GMC family oxidoreductase [Polyangia bacterium]